MTSPSGASVESWLGWQVVNNYGTFNYSTERDARDHLAFCALEGIPSRLERVTTTRSVEAVPSAPSEGDA